MSPNPDQNRRKLRTKRKLVFTLVAIGIAVLPVALFELSLAVIGWDEGNTQDREVTDPFIGFSGDHSLFEKTSSGTHFQIKESRLGYFRPASFLAQKPQNGFRVFVIGGSTVQGRPWETETAFAKWLELGLQVCEPDRQVEVINCGGVSYASYRLRLIFDEIVDYSPDLIILCTGHNEFLEQRTYPTESRVPGIAASLHQLFSGLRSYRWLRAQVLRTRATTPPEENIKEKVITKLDYENGLDRFTTENLQRNMVVSHFQFNVRMMIQSAKRHGIRLFFALPPINQKDCPPFKNRNSWSPGDQSPFADFDIHQFETVATSDRSADFYFFRGQKNLSAGRLDDARQDFDQAIEKDICPLRMTQQLRQVLLDEFERSSSDAENVELMLLDLQDKCRSNSRDGIVGKGMLVDHVHPSIGTHQQIARWLLEQMHESKVVQLPKGWETQFESAIKNHTSSLDFGYYQRGKDRLESVLKWSRGKAYNPLK